MEQNPSWEATRFPANQEISHILWNPRGHYCVHKRTPFVLILIQMTSGLYPRILFFYVLNLIYIFGCMGCPKESIQVLDFITCCIFKGVPSLLPNPHTWGLPPCQLSAATFHIWRPSSFTEKSYCGEKDRLNLANFLTFWLILSLYSYWKQNSVVSVVGQYRVSLPPVWWNLKIHTLHSPEEQW